MILFHVTPHADAILREGFRHSTGDYGFVGDDGAPVLPTGVFLSDKPVGGEEAVGDLLEVDFPDGFQLDDFAIVEEAAPVGRRREWLVPANVLNRHATVRLGPPSPYA